MKLTINRFLIIGCIFFTKAGFCQIDWKAKELITDSQNFSETCLDLGYPDHCKCMSAAYNQAANHQLNSSCWNMWANLSFTYWKANQGGLTIAHSISYTDAGSDLINVDSRSFGVHKRWKPGFKIGLGVNSTFDHWSALLEYTWFRSKTSNSESPPAAASRTHNSVWLINNWSLVQPLNTASFLSAVWNLSLDLLDLGFKRPCYTGTHLILSPYGGIRSGWIRQQIKIHATPSSNPQTQALPTSSAIFNNRSHVWLIGPRIGMEGKWHLFSGLRIEADCAGCIAYNRFSKVNIEIDPMQTTNNSSNVYPSIQNSIHIKNGDTVRFNNDMIIGLGWGRYLDCHKYHFDFLATYDLQIFWGL